MNLPAAPSPRHRLPLPGLVLIALSWLIPGLGFILCGRMARGLILFVVIVTTFGIGLALHGGVVWPSWSRADESFNLMNNLIFLVQMLAGLPAGASLAASRAGLDSGYTWLGGLPQHAFFELGSYFLVVAGALNYFAAANFHDRMVKTAARYREQEFPGVSQAAPAQNAGEGGNQAGAA